MKKRNKQMIKNSAVTGVAIVGSFLIKKLIGKARHKSKGPVSEEEIHQAPWPEAIKWTLAASVVSGMINLFLKRYTEEGLSKLES